MSILTCALRRALTFLEKKETTMSDLQTSDSQTTVSVLATDDPCLVAAPAPDPVAVPVAADQVSGPDPAAASPSTVAAPQRSLDEIHQALIEAKEQHARDLAAVQASKTTLAALSGEFHAALSWFAEREKQIAADIEDLRGSVGNWLLKEIK
ncbi:MAG: hypothetical protein F8N39_11720 [Clostridiaceae bacterium]|nr:hypothetical protein [Clostridiaceae bacterium]